MKKRGTTSTGALILTPLKKFKIRFEIPERITNASMKRTYVAPDWNIRDGGEDHKKWPSKGPTP